MKTIVIKFGTSLLTRGGARLDQAADYGQLGGGGRRPRLFG